MLLSRPTRMSSARRESAIWKSGSATLAPLWRLPEWLIQVRALKNGHSGYEHEVTSDSVPWLSEKLSRRKLFPHLIGLTCHKIRPASPAFRSAMGSVYRVVYRAVYRNPSASGLEAPEYMGFGVIGGVSPLLRQTLKSLTNHKLQGLQRSHQYIFWCESRCETSYRYVARKITWLAAQDHMARGFTCRLKGLRGAFDNGQPRPSPLAHTVGWFDRGD
jgi:hypothetical protein